MNSNKLALDKIRSAIPDVQWNFYASKKSIYHYAAFLTIVYAQYHLSDKGLEVALKHALQKIKSSEGMFNTPPTFKERPKEWEGAKYVIELALNIND